MPITYRQGAVGAMLDEYEKAITELKTVIELIPDDAITMITDAQTADENCRSVQSILAHVVCSGFGYAVSIYNLQGHNVIRPPKFPRLSIKEYLEDLDSLLSYTVTVFNENYPSQQFDNSVTITSRWGQIYDAEQMAEHAIVHVLRHRRQIERILIGPLAKAILH
ncbi:DinB family protein [Mucilaginibacter sp. FT3.2]|uniref:DinB family protein n=1 Tax=Mucilaginibacter sp. FT3.2 TaxID=2723090 RepID=UPI001617AD16|nr:DinB family protein [Mucilaginibacter sp. FT3.2]MBB6229726.1 hypothetical protein [Mucilaginibacter sp. FT3.2]